MILTLDNIIDSHKNKIAFVIANGPSTKTYINLIKEAASKKDKYIIIVCNEVDKMLENINIDLASDINPDYWVLANSQQTVENYHKNFNKLENTHTTLVYADSVDLTENSENLLKINFIPYDQRHFNKKECREGFRLCCKKNLIEKKPKKTIQEYLKEYTNFEKHYGTGSTVALHMLSLGILIGCKKIFISGVDLDYNLGYFDGKTSNPDTFNPWLKEILEDFKIIHESAKIKNVQIINLSKISPLKEIFTTKE